MLLISPISLVVLLRSSRCGLSTRFQHGLSSRRRHGLLLAWVWFVGLVFVVVGISCPLRARRMDRIDGMHFWLRYVPVITPMTHSFLSFLFLTFFPLPFPSPMHFFPDTLFFPSSLPPSSPSPLPSSPSPLPFSSSLPSQQVWVVPLSLCSAVSVEVSTPKPPMWARIWWVRSCTASLRMTHATQLPSLITSVRYVDLIY